MAAIGKKTKQKKKTRKMSQGKLRLKYPTWVIHNTEKRESCLILLVHSFDFNLAKFIFLKQIFI